MNRLLAAAVLAVLVAVPLAAEARNDRAATVMSRNLYIGADLTPLIGITSVPAFIAVATGVYAVVQASDIPGRAEALAAEIAAAAPDLIGVQEAVIWRTQFPPDFAPTPNATTVDADFLQSLLAGLAARGTPYTVVATHVTNDLEVPILTAGGACCREVRLTDREVILARTVRPANDPLVLSNVQSGLFAAQVPLPLPGGAVYVQRRGWLSVDVTLRGAQFRFVTTHLEPEGPGGAVQEAQGLELLAGPANTSLPVVLVCDCNSRADGTGTATYSDLLAGGFTDAWSARWPRADGFTCCQDEDLRNPTTALDQRIDLVLVRGRAHVRHATVTGGDEGDLTPAGLWPSDHAGVMATIQFKP